MISVILIASILLTVTIAAASMAVAELLRRPPKFEDAKPSGLGDFTFPTAIEGRPIPLLWGTTQVKGPNVVWWGDFQARKITESTKTGLWSSKRTTVGFEYDVGVQLALCLGQIEQVSKIWIGDTLVVSGSVQDGTYDIDEPKLFGGSKLGSGGMRGTFAVHSGSSTQAVDSYLSSHQAEAVPHRGICHVVWRGGYIGNSTSIKPWKFEVQRYPNQLGLTSNRHIVNGNDSNPAAVLYELMTDTEWGYGFPASDIDVANFIAVGNTLFTEGNGFSMLLDRVIDSKELLEILQEQIDGLVYLDQEDGKIKLSLARDDYDIDTVPQILEDDVIDTEEFVRGTWEETTNHVMIKFIDRSRNYFPTFAQAQSLANKNIQGGEIVPITINMPGVQDKTLATNLASRELRQRTVPLAKGTLIVNRKFWNLKPNDVVAWTNENMGFVKLPIRIGKISYGDLANGNITLNVVQDVFKFSAAFYGEPIDTLWTAPTQDITPAPADEQVAIEAPYAITSRDPESPHIIDRVWASLKQQDNEVTYKIYQRNAVGVPSGDWVEDSDVIPRFMRIGKLRAAISMATAAGTDSILVDASADTLADMEAEFTDSPDSTDIGQNLVNLCMIGSDPDTAEFIGVTSVTNQTTHLELENVWRGMLDTTARAHAVDTPVYLIFAGGELNQSAIPQGNNVHVQVRGESFTDEVTAGEANTMSLTMDNRGRRPYPPTQLAFNGSVLPTTVDPDAGASLDAKGINVQYTRRDFETSDEVEGITTDAALIDADFPTKHTTQYQADIGFEQELGDLGVGLESFWKLEETGAATRVDETAASLDLTPTGSPPNGTGKLGNGVDLSGSSQWLAASGSTILDFNGSFTLAAWVKGDALSGAARTIFSKWDETTPERQYLAGYSSTQDRFRFVLSGNGTNFQELFADNFGSPSIATWYFIVAWFDETERTMWIQVNNGEPDSARFTLAATAHSGGSASFRVGSIRTTIDTGFWNGIVDAAGAWSRVLTSAERTALYNGATGYEHPFGTTGTLDLHQGLQAWWRMEEAAGNDRLDSTPHKIHLAESASYPSTSSGRIGNAADNTAGSSIYFTHADKRRLTEFSDEEVEMGAWVQLNSKSADMTTLSRHNPNTDDREYKLWFDQSAGASGQFAFTVNDDGTSGNDVTVLASTFGSPAVDTWYWVSAYHDPVANTIGIQVNNGTIDTTAHTLGIYSGDATPVDFRVGAAYDSGGSNTEFWDGLIDEVFLYRRLLTSGERTALYNSGSGVTYPRATGTYAETDTFTTTYANPANILLNRARLIVELGERGFPQRLTAVIRTRHTIGGTTYAATQLLGPWTVDLSESDISDDAPLGVLSQNEVSAAYVAPVGGTYTFNIAFSHATGIVEAQINGGGYSTVIAATNVTGTLAGVTAGDRIETRHTESSVGGNNYLEIVAPSDSQGAYGVLI